jgi:arginine decarboxylase
VATVEALRTDASGLAPSGDVDLPEQQELELETAMRPRDAFFAAAEQVEASHAIGRIAAELVTPYPPGVPVLAPGEVISAQAVEFLQTGVKAGMLISEAADPEMSSFRVVTRDAERR